MKITDILTYAVKGRHWPRFPMVFVEVEIDEGITGLGESLLYQSNGIIEAIHTMKGLLIGKTRAISSDYGKRCSGWEIRVPPSAA